MRKIHILIAFLMAYGLMACNKVPAIKEKTVFENLTACKCDTSNGDPGDCKIYLSDRFDLIDVKGKLYSMANYSVYIRLDGNDAAKVDNDRFPVWKMRAGIIAACNIPTELSSRDFDGVNVRLSCRLYYEPLPWPGRSLISKNGYSAELLRIELIQ